jgi:hypothetical protein
VGEEVEVLYLGGICETGRARNGGKLKKNLGLNDIILRLAFGIAKVFLG